MAPAARTLAAFLLDEVEGLGAVALHGAREVVAEEAPLAARNANILAGLPGLGKFELRLRVALPSLIRQPRGME